MKNILFACSLLPLLIRAHDNTQNPTLEQISTSKIVEITMKCIPDATNFNSQLWQEIIVNVNEFINTCYASDAGHVSNDQVFAELHKTVDFIRERTDANQGIHGALEIHVGQPSAQQLNSDKATLQQEEIRLEIL